MTLRLIAMSGVAMFSVWCVALASPSQPQATPSRDTYSGSYVFAFEKSEFTPSGTRERWWLRGDIGEIKRRAISPVFVSVEGQLRPRDHYEHLGGYSREMIVTRV